MSEYSKTALSWCGLKDAILYFPHVIPFGVGIDIVVDSLRAKWRGAPIGQSRSTDKLGKLLTAEIVPPNLRNDDFFASLNEINRASVPFMDAQISASLDEHFKLRPGAKENFQAAVFDFFAKYPRLRSLPLIIDSEFTGEDDVTADNLTVTIPLLRLIDASTTSWDQIVDFRRDNDAIEKLRRFRVFVYQNYTGKTKDFIEDDILTRLADYEQAVKKWGFATTSGTITTLLNSSVIAGGVAGSFLTAYFNAPLPAIASAMTATGLAIANMAVSLGQQRFTQKELMANNPVSYISYAKEKLTG
jgi:hypothetical protein